MTKQANAFIDHVKANHPRIHKAITGHPAYDADKHNSLKAVMNDLSDAVSEDDCFDVDNSIKAQSDKIGPDAVRSMLFGSDQPDAKDGVNDPTVASSDDEAKKQFVNELVDAIENSQSGVDGDDDSEELEGDDFDADEDVTA
jgi:hypothetical protein